MIKEKEEPLVSVIVPSYNHHKYVKETIESIVNQTYKNIELIVIDDGSKDSSVQIIQELSDKYGFAFINRPNKGLSVTLNEGIKLANGIYISLCASDDIYVLDKIEKQVKFLEKNKEYIMSYGNKINFYENGMSQKIRNKNYRSGDIFNDLLLLKYFIPPVSVLYRKEVFEKVGFFDINLAEEGVDMFLRISKSYKIGYQNDFYYYYRVHENNTINDIEKMEDNTNQILNKWKDEELYRKAIIRKDLLYFRNYSTTKKLKSLNRLPLSSQVLFDRVFYSGLLRLLIPKFIYKSILKK